MLDLGVDLILPRMRALPRLAQGMRVVKCHLDDECRFSAGQVQFTAKEADCVPTDIAK